MFQRIFTKYWLVVNIGITFLIVWLVLPGSVKMTSFSSLLWMSVLLAELFVLLPSVYSGETLAAARSRGVKSLSTDAFAYAGLFFALFLFLQWFNGGCAPEYDSSAGVWGFSPPATPWLPSSIVRLDSFRAFSLFTSLLVAGCCLRNVVGKRAKRLLLQWLCIGSGVFAVYAVTQGCLGVSPYKEMMRHAFSGGFGTLFGFWMLVSIGSFADAVSARTRRSKLIYVFGVLANLTGMLFFASLPAMLLYFVMSILLLIYMGAYLSIHVPAHFIVKTYVLTVIIYVAVFVLSVLVFPDNPVASKVGQLSDISLWWENLAATKTVRSNAAMTIWQGHMWFGTGADGFEYYLGTVMNDTDWGSIRIDKGLVYNDVLQVLCEFGVLGSAALAAVIITMIIPLCNRAHIAWAHDTRDANAGRKYILRISPLVVAGVVATLCCFAESFVSSPFKAPGVLVSFFIVLLAMPGFLPAR